MKTKTLLFEIAFLCSVVTTHAQSWLTSGNNITNPSVNFIGTKNNKAFVIRTNNIERLKITYSGRFGFGTLSPDERYTLSVNPSVAGNGIKIGDPGSGYSLYTQKSGYGYALYVKSTSPTNDSAAIYAYSNSIGIAVYGYNAAGGPGTYGYSKDGVGAEGYSGGNGIGVFGYSLYGNAIFGLSGSGSSGDSYAGYFLGNVFSTGSYQTSDENLKKNIKDFSSALDIINQLHPKQYDYRQDGNYKLMSLPQGNHYGLIAQDVEKILPGLIKDSKFETRYIPNNTSKSETINFKALNYTEFIPIIIKAVQEQQKIINSQQDQIHQQQQQIDELKQMVQTIVSGNNMSTSQSAKINSGYLQQNAPNPFSTKFCHPL